MKERSIRNIRLLKRLSSLSLVTVLLSACVAVLPSETTNQKHPWTDFNSAKESYDSIELDKTTVITLKEKGFDPEKTANMRILNYLDVVKRFSPILTKADLPQGVQDCIAAKEKCIAFSASPTNITRERVGNVALDLLGFKKETKISGWKFEAIFVMVDDVVTYKIWSGTPDIEEYDKKLSPLGPAQSLTGILSP